MYNTLTRTGEAKLAFCWCLACVHVHPFIILQNCIMLHGLAVARLVNKLLQCFISWGAVDGLMRSRDMTWA